MADKVLNLDELVYDESKKLTKWEKEPRVTDLKNDLTNALPDHNTQVNKIKTWIDNLNVEGKAKPKKRTGRSSVVPKLIRKQAEWRYAALSEPFLSDEDLFKASPVSWEDKKSAEQNGMVLNHQFRNLIDRVKLIDNYVRTTVDEGTVILRTGWDFEEEEQDVEVPIIQEVPLQDPQEIAMALEQGLPLIQEVQIGTEIVKQMVTIKNQPSVDICHYGNVIVDPTCNNDPDKANFIIYRFETSLSDLEKTGKYQNLDNINIDSNSILGTADEENAESSSSFQFKDKPRKKFLAYEYWGFWDIDGSGKTKPIVATWVGDVLIRLEENPYPDGELPFVIVPYLPVRNSVYGEPDGALLEENQKILGAVTRGMIDIMGRSANGQIGMRKDALDVTNRRKFERGMDYEFNAQIDPRMGFFTHTYPEIPASAQFMVELQNQDAESLTGVKAFHGGISGDALGNTSATAARGVLDAASKRELGILRRLADGMVKVGKKICAMNAEFLSEEEVVRITNEEFVTINRDDLKGNFDLRLDINTAEMDNSKAQELAFMLQTMGNSMPAEMSQIILADIAKLRKMPELAKRIEEYKPQPDPVQEQLKQLEVQKLQEEIKKLAAEAKERKAQAMLDAARARNLNSDTDIKDLDFLEQEEGVKQERELQKVGEQAKANQQMKERDRDLELRNKFLENLYGSPGEKTS